MESKRKKYSPEEKIAILKKHLLEKMPLSDVCDQYGLHPTVFYRWQKILFENGSHIFQPPKQSRETGLKNKISELELKLSRKNEVVSELMEQLICLKKNPGGI